MKKSGTPYSSRAIFIMASICLALVGGVGSTSQVAAKGKEPTLSIPKAPARPTCVGWAGCAGTINDAIKNAKANSTVFVKAGIGLADNLTITKAVKICAAETRDTCLATVDEQSRFRLIRKDESKPCITVKPSRGSVKITGLILQDLDLSSGACLLATARRGSEVNLSIDQSTLEEVELNVSGLTQVSISSTQASRADWTFAGAGSSINLTDFDFFGGDLKIKQVRHVAMARHNRFAAAAIDISDSPSTLDFASLERSSLALSGSAASTLKIGAAFDTRLQVSGSGTFTLADSTLTYSLIEISGQAIRSLENNTFINTKVLLAHQGLAAISKNIFEDNDDDIEKSTIEASLVVASGVNQISGNTFGSDCQTDQDCQCKIAPVLKFKNDASAPGSARTTQFYGNTICTDEPVWMEGEARRDDAVRDNCLLTYDRKVASASKSHYRRFKHPPATHLYVHLAGSGKPLPPQCKDFQ